MYYNNAKIIKPLNGLKKWLIPHSDTVIGIDFGTQSIKIAELAFNKAKPILKNIGITDFTTAIDSDGKITESDTVVKSLRHLLTTSGVTSREAVVAISSSKIFVREITLPAMTENELKEAIKWDSENYVPYAPGSYFYDFAILPSINELESRILFVAAPSEVVSNIVSIVKDAGLKPIAVDIEPLALYRTIDTGENCAVLDIGAELSQIILFQKGIPCVTRSIPVSGRQFTEVIMRSLDLDFAEAESLKKRQKGLLRRPDLQDNLTDIHQRLVMLSDELVRELRRTLDYYQVQNKSTAIDKIVLTGGGAKMDNLALYFSKQLEMPIIQHDVLAALDYPASFNDKYLQDVAPQLAVAVGLALRGGEI
ncbi:Cell division protein FtsA [bioreactor metagenome]|uniref:Cell division protein FtsA n=1 Tax=bioreactor metagenome TaxID=1076179 RepID=A0A645C1U1_9ZZZZ